MTKEIKKFITIIFYNKINQILLQDRTSISKWGEDWAIFGGHVESGETFEQALLREIKEELNYNLKKDEFKEVKFIRDINKDTIWEGYIYAAKLPNNHENLFEVLEGDGMKLFSPKEAKN